jgi:protein-S-isoprenylcysteine O-methyltransferase
MRWRTIDKNAFHVTNQYHNIKLTYTRITAGSNFHHLIRTERDEKHKLVTHGIYAYLRHPGYFGWFWWCIGTQILLSNPICIAAYAFASWRFFSERIPEEEDTLIKFFGEVRIMLL